MVLLRSCEILDELKKLGVETLSEQLEILMEYSVYCYFVSREEKKFPATDFPGYSFMRLKSKPR